MKILHSTILIGLLSLSSIATRAQSIDDIREDLRTFREHTSCADLKKKNAAAGAECERDSNEVLGLADVPESQAQMQSLKKVAAHQKLLEEGRNRSSSKSFPDDEQKVAAQKRSEAEERQHERRTWLKFIAAFCVFGFIAKWKGASFLRWGIVGIFTYGTLAMAGYLAL